ncbi:hypothetical protein D4N35_008895 [Siminovitchia fortis]|uniref:Uncharacterized protein n=2 Tax=Siminovitchia fortis TaxID=254758 RepID=A0A443IU56_9BACI|nr:hypothetical protein D4N35_008895 [Siminovitchia fortis]
MIMNPINTRLNANVRILLILLEYFFAIQSPPKNKLYHKAARKRVPETNKLEKKEKQLFLSNKKETVSVISAFIGGMKMEDLIRPLVNHCASRPTTVAVLMVNHTKELTAEDLFDVIIYAVATDQKNPEQSRYFDVHGIRVGLFIVDERLFRKKMLSGTISPHFLYGSEVLFERDRYIESIKKETPIYDCQMKLGLEFAELIQSYTIGKNLFEDGHFPDAYDFLVSALHHLARFALIEKGIQAGTALWNQIKNEEPEILKLFEELIKSEEPIEKRLELLILASSFFIYSKTTKGSEHILEILNEGGIWSYEMIAQHPKIKIYGSSLGTFLEYLIEKELIVPIQVESTFTGIYERYYRVKKTC